MVRHRIGPPPTDSQPTRCRLSSRSRREALLRCEALQPAHGAEACRPPGTPTGGRPRSATFCNAPRRRDLAVSGCTIIARGDYVRPHQAAQTLPERGVDFKDAKHVFAGRTLDRQDDREDYGEVRMLTVGYLAGRMVMVVWTPRGKARRVISMRKCNEREQAKYRDGFEEV